jgi:tRNA pseudouridine38-40 synthase
MTLFKIVLAYDGTDYVGWQRQDNGTSIQALIEDALLALDGREVTVTGAGRTDAGVHALGQVAAFTIARDLGADALARALNAHLPPAIRVVAAEEAPAGFHPRFGARTKTYRYRLWNAEVMCPFERRYAWHVPGPLDVTAMAAAARLIEGRHDFASFQATGSAVATTEREIFESVLRTPHDAPRTSHDAPRSSHLAPRTSHLDTLCYEVTGSGFLRHMVRIIVGSLVEVGRGRKPVEWITAAIGARDRAQAGPTAPPHGLFLVRVGYTDALAAGS